MSPRTFFFSSRRRHTRCGRDWSSDVCSSDLYWWFPPVSFLGYRGPDLSARVRTDRYPQFLRMVRSEERRVGKECGDRWVAERQQSIQRVGHARTVGLHQQVVGEVDAEVDVLQ